MNQFRRHGRGAIVTTGSDAAHTPRIGMSAYGVESGAESLLSVGLELAGSGVRRGRFRWPTDTDMQRTPG